eukprot:TRINITY_DN1184_c0_g1_i1.p1 TRINITY_DN1184_c0_g1~~TRINITY_DN1184_c0_g1_i1.p1  ORF type:complete len:270 (+),score=70.26 TRINITY_DN1184_c0_g1_i1:39-848(+)
MNGYSKEISQILHLAGDSPTPMEESLFFIEERLSRFLKNLIKAAESNCSIYRKRIVLSEGAILNELQFKPQFFYTTMYLIENSDSFTKYVDKDYYEEDVISDSSDSKLNPVREVDFNFFEDFADNFFCLGKLNPTETHLCNFNMYSDEVLQQTIEYYKSQFHYTASMSSSEYLRYQRLICSSFTFNQTKKFVNWLNLPSKKYKKLSKGVILILGSISWRFCAELAKIASNFFKKSGLSSSHDAIPVKFYRDAFRQLHLQHRFDTVIYDY